MDELLKGNFKVRKPVKINETKTDDSNEFEKRALEGVGGSMVFIDRKNLVWDGEEESK